MRKVTELDIKGLACPLCGATARVLDTVVQESGRHVNFECSKCGLVAFMICRGMVGVEPVAVVANVVEPTKEKKVEEPRKSNIHTPALKFKKKGE